MSGERQALKVLLAEGGLVRLSEWQQRCQERLGYDPRSKKGGPLRDFLLRVPGARLCGSGADTAVYLEPAQAGAPPVAQKTAADVRLVLRTAGPVRLNEWSQRATALLGYDPHTAGTLASWLRSIPGVAVSGSGLQMAASLSGSPDGQPDGDSAAAPAAVPVAPATAAQQAPVVPEKTVEAVHGMLRSAGPVRLNEWNQRALSLIGHDPHIGNLSHWLHSIPGVAVSGSGLQMTVSLSGSPDGQPDGGLAAAAVTQQAPVVPEKTAEEVRDMLRTAGPLRLNEWNQRALSLLGHDPHVGNLSRWLRSVPGLSVSGSGHEAIVSLCASAPEAVDIEDIARLLELIREEGPTYMGNLIASYQRRYGTKMRCNVVHLLRAIPELSTLGEPPYAQVFIAGDPRNEAAIARNEEDNDIDGETLDELTEDDMRMLGMEPLADRKRLVHALHTFRATGLAAVDDSVVGAIAKEHTQASEDILTALCNKANVCVWLLSLEIPFESVQLFDAAGVDGVVLMHLSDKDLQDIGVSSLGQRRKVTRRTDRMRSSYFAALEAHFSGKRAPPNEYVCPITMELMGDPVVAPDGFTYEREAITHWLVHGKKTSPMTGQAMPPGPLVPTIALRSAIKAFKDANGL
eukprot:m51a1_g6003 hypothetical protein (630) ;mRNA; r:26270-32033